MVLCRTQPRELCVALAIGQHPHRKNLATSQKNPAVWMRIFVNFVSHVSFGIIQFDIVGLPVNCQSSSLLGVNRNGHHNES